MNIYTYWDTDSKELINMTYAEIDRVAGRKLIVVNAEDSVFNDDIYENYCLSSDNTSIEAK